MVLEIFLLQREWSRWSAKSCQSTLVRTIEGNSSFQSLEYSERQRLHSNQQQRKLSCSASGMRQCISLRSRLALQEQSRHGRPFESTQEKARHVSTLMSTSSLAEPPLSDRFSHELVVCYTENMDTMISRAIKWDPNPSHLHQDVVCSVSRPTARSRLLTTVVMIPLWDGVLCPHRHRNEVLYPRLQRTHKSHLRKRKVRCPFESDLGLLDTFQTTAFQDSILDSQTLPPCQKVKAVKSQVVPGLLYLLLRPEIMSRSHKIQEAIRETPN